MYSEEEIDGANFRYKFMYAHEGPNKNPYIMSKEDIQKLTDRRTFIQY